MSKHREFSAPGRIAAPRHPSSSHHDPVINHGCRLNAYEAEAMRRLVTDVQLDDVVVVNSCAVTGEAVRQTRQSIRRARRDQPHARIVVTGCAAQIDADSFAAMPEVDHVVGNVEKLDPALWQRLGNRPDSTTRPGRVLVNDIMSVRETAPHLIDGYGDRSRAFLQIQTGCDHRCTFCIIPFGRGNSRSVPVDTVCEQAQRLVDAGHRELVLTGVDITSYGPDLQGAPTLGGLVAALLDRVPQLFRLRLSSIDGAEIDDILLDRITGDERIAPYLHLSLQSGDDMILKRMKRRHTRAQAIAFCERVRARRAAVAFGADLIAGFPTETEAMFENSLALIADADLAFVHVFPYSPRAGTPAARMPQLPRSVVKVRASRLRSRAHDALHTFLDAQIGKPFDAIVESGGRARLGNFAQVQLPGSVNRPTGSVVSLTVDGRQGDMLTAAPGSIKPL